MLDCPRNRSNAFIMHITEPMFECCHSLPIPVDINTSQWSFCLVNMANILHLMGDTKSENFFRMNMDKDWSWFFKLWFESFGNIVYNASVLKHKQKKCISSRNVMIQAVL